MYKPVKISAWNATTTTVVLGVVALGIVDAAASDAPFEHPRSLAFLEQRGGLEIGPLEKQGNRWQLPVHCNVSGIKRITTDPSVIHSGLAWSRSVARIEDDTILITVITAMQGSRAPSANCEPAPLSRLYDENYQVFYLDPDGTRHPLGTVSTR